MIYLLLFILNYFLYLLKTTNIFIYISYIDIEYVLSKIISSWSSIENTIIFFFMLNTIFFFLFTKDIILTNKKINNLLIILSYSYLYYSIIYNEIYFKTLFFNPLLNHTMGSIHPPLIIFSIFLIRYYINKEKNNILNIIFFFISISLWTGSIWSTSLFGWNGLWMWDPIENISFCYWILILIIIHIKKKIYYIFSIFFFYAIDFYFFILFKIKITNSIHIFQININQWKINTYPLIYLFFYLTLALTCLLMLILNKEIKKINIINIKIYSILYILIFIILIFFIFNHYYYTQQVTQKQILNIYYEMFYLSSLLFYTLYTKKNMFFKKHIIIITLLLIYINIYYIIYIFFYIIIKNKKNDLLINHFFYFLLLYLFIFFLSEATEYNPIYTNIINYMQIEQNITLYRDIISNYKSILENINIYNTYKIQQENSILNLYKNNSFSFFYKKMKNIINDKNENIFYISTTKLTSYSTNLKDIIIINTKYLFLILMLLIICMLKYLKKMRFFLLK